MTGVSTDNFNRVSLIDSLIGNREGSTVQIEVARFLAQMLAQLGPQVDTVVLLRADLDWPAGSLAFVTGDTAANNGQYRKTGAVGSGGWSRQGDLPQQIVRDRSQHTGTQAITTVTGLQDALEERVTTLLVDEALKLRDAAIAERATKVDVEEEIEARKTLAMRLGDKIDIRKAVAGEDGYVDIVTPEETAEGLIRLLAFSRVTGKLAFGKLDDETLRLLGVDLYGAGVVFPLAKPGEDQVVNLAGLKLDPHTFARALGIHVVSGELELGKQTAASLAALKADLNIGAGAGGLGRRTVAPTIALIWQSGQSLSVGAIGGAFPPDGDRFLATSPYTPYGWMFNTGLRGVSGGALDASKLVDFIPAQDDCDETTEQRGQVTGSSMMAQIARRNAMNATVMDMVWRGHGRGGRKISELQANSGSFLNGLVELQRAIAIAALYGRDVSLPAIMWTQGEQDRDTSLAEYKAGLVSLRASYNAQYRPLLPARHPEIDLIMDQVSSSSYAGPGTPAQIAQYEAMRDLPGFYMSCPKYWAQLSDSVHLRPLATDLLGEYQGQAWHEICVKGNTGFRPTMPKQITRNGATITLTLRTPFGDPLFFDVTTLNKQTNFGFEYEGANITSVVLTDPVAGIITLTLDKAAGGKLRYAYTSTVYGENGGPGSGGYGQRPGAWGNVRDTSLRRAVTLPNTELPNWLVTFEETVA